MKFFASSSLLIAVLLSGCSTTQETTETLEETREFSNSPLVSEIFTADPSAHVFDGKVYIYPSHDIESGIPQDDLGSHFDMQDYHVFSQASPDGEIVDHGVALAVTDVAWAERQMWAPDAAEKDGNYYLYFPAKDKDGIFRIGVASATSPTGPFVAEPSPIEGSYSIDPAVLKDEDGAYYMYFGGIWGGQLQNWDNNTYNADAELKQAEEVAFLPRIAKLSDDMKSFAEPVREVQIVDSEGQLFTEADNDKRFFEAAWVHKFQNKYYLSYSTGDTHFIQYAIADNPYGPFTYQGVILNPVQGWTNHHSIVEVNDKWYLYYHDTEISGETHLRNIKVTELKHNEDGSIVPLTVYNPTEN